MALENILRRIQDDCDSKIRDLRARKEEEEKKIMSRARRDIDELQKERRKEIARAVEEEKKRRLSLARLSLKNEILALKHRIIEEVFEEAFKAVKNLPEEEYRKLFQNLMEENAEPGAGRVLISGKDIERLGPEFFRRLNKHLTEKRGAEFRYAPEKKEGLEGGFILETGSVKIDCSLEAVFAAARRELEKQTADALFSDG